MATFSGPYGFRLAKVAGNRPQNQGASQYPITSGYSVSIFNGTPVKLVSGYLQPIATSGIGGSENYIGVFGGCQYTNPTTKQPTYANFWQSGTVASDAYGFVYDDPNAIYQIQSDTANVNWVQYVGQAVQINNAASGSLTTGLSNATVSNGSVGTAASNSFTIVGVVNDPYNTQATAGVYNDILVRVRFGLHAYERSTVVNS